MDWLHGAWFAHRGLHRPAGDGLPARPENSLSAFHAARDAGFGVELDVQLSADGVPVVFHDQELDRICACPGLVSGLTAAELGRIPLLGTADTIPTLARALDLLAGRVPLYIELKPYGRAESLCAAVLGLLRGHGGSQGGGDSFPQHTAVASFDPEILCWFKEHAPELARGLIVESEPPDALAPEIRKGLDAGCAPDFVSCDIQGLPNEEATRLREAGTPIAAWTLRCVSEHAAAAPHADAFVFEAMHPDACPA